MPRHASPSRDLDLAETNGHYAEPAPSADRCARRVAFQGWSYVLAPWRGGLALFYEELWHRGAHRVPLATLTAAGTVVGMNGVTLGFKDELRTTTVRRDPLAIEADKRDAIPCACRGCAPVAVDDGRRPHGVMLQSQESTANVAGLRRRKVIVSPRVEPADSDAPACAGCGKAVPIAIDGICWLCLAEGHLREKAGA